MKLNTKIEIEKWIFEFGRASAAANSEYSIKRQNYGKLNVKCQILLLKYLQPPKTTKHKHLLMRKIE